MTKPVSAFAKQREEMTNRMFSVGVWTWLSIVEDEKDRLSDGAQVALESLRADLERMARHD